MSELVSIITPVYNAERYIKQAIDSVISQTYESWELILVDDCSQDSSRLIIEEYSKLEKRINFISLKNNKGVATARNAGIQLAKGKYIAFLDSDDLWLPQKLERQISFMYKQNASMSFTAYELINEYGEKLNKIVDVPAFVDYRGLLKGNVIGCSTVMIDREKINNFQFPILKHEDYVAWLKLLKNNLSACGLNEVLVYYRKVNNSLSANKFKSAKWVWNIYKNIEELPYITCCYYFINYAIRGILKHYF